MAAQFYGAQYVADLLGVTTSTLHNWSKNPPEGFPEAEVELVVHGEKVTGRGWSAHQLMDLRQWWQSREEMSDEDAAAHWLVIDDHMVTRRRMRRDSVHMNQALLFDAA